QNRVDAACPLWTADVCLLEQKPYESLILQLYDVGCLLFGDYVQASGQTLDYYVDLRKIISNPQVFHKVLDAYAEILNRLEFDRIAGIPYGSLPTATGLSLQLQHPMIFPRKEVKAHGTRRVVEGEYFPEERVVVVDDILLTGNSAIEGADKLRSVGLIVTDVVVLIDKATGAKDLLKAQGYEAHSVLTLPQMAMTLHEAGRINKLQMDALLRSCDRN
ncbi:MAG: orotate phosphoribosyltransferase, partial [Cyanobacteria bacterium P01_H01_bin.15]